MVTSGHLSRNEFAAKQSETAQPPENVKNPVDDHPALHPKPARPPNMNSNTHAPELISALADGQLPDDKLAQVLASFRADGSAMACWDAYHVIGEVLRSPSQVVAGDAAGFVARLGSRLALEPSLVAAVEPAIVPVMVRDTFVARSAPAANDGSFRWKLVAGFASVAAVAAMGWTSVGLFGPAPAPQLAQAAAPEQILVSSPQGTMVRDARLEELLAAHKQFGGTSALQVPSGFLRNATFETPQSNGR
jgi:sigma-E factor negative regulatory protein RseA